MCRAKETFFDLLSMSLLVTEFPFNAMLCSNLDNESSDSSRIE